MNRILSGPVEKTETLKKIINLPVPRSGIYPICRHSCKLINLPKYLAAHTRSEARKQIEASQDIRKNDDLIRSVFHKYARQSADIDKYAHIPKEKLICAVEILGREIQRDEVDDFFRLHDLNGDGVFDLDEFKHAILAPHKLPKYEAIRKAFDLHSIKRSEANATAPEEYIQPEKAREALETLSLKTKMLEKVLAYFTQGALSDGVISFEEFNQAILSISPLPDEQEVVRVYQEHAVPGTYLYIPTDALRDALLELSLVVTDEQLTHFRRTVDLNFNGCIKYNAFKHIVLSPSPTEVWASTLPLARLLADALPKFHGCDHLRVVSSLTPQEADMVAEEVCQSLKDVLKQHVAELKQSFIAMDEQVFPSFLAHRNPCILLPHPFLPLPLFTPTRAGC